ncbi:MAG: 1-deoxy-D-xylulose-5-phosphate synthase [Eubacteriales bacterium]|nr:1-deoxy-D-xylulose-5-phosphate synthase [Eubacteriales bacterium]
MSDILSKINRPEELKTLTEAEVESLGFELRETIIQRVSENGGHLASNLGVIELTLALARIFDFTAGHDQLIFDVGHQSYAWKLISGRREAFKTLRQESGLAGFPKREESPYDFFNTGHASTSISAALGLSRAQAIKGQEGSVIAIIGDGAIGGGMAFEALNDAKPDDDILVILNDNQMSIAENVGSLAKRLGELRIKADYQDFKRRWRPRLENHPKLLHSLRSFKSLDRLLIRRTGVFFESLNWRYYGPLNGHDIAGLERHLKALKGIPGPKLLHIYTVKGRGYAYAEESPESYHGVGSFEIPDGLSPKLGDRQSSFSKAFGSSLLRHAETSPELCAITAAMPGGTGLKDFAEKYPERFFDVGIAEQHAACLAAGLAAGGMKPVLALYSTFLQRAYDQLIHDIALQRLAVMIAVDRAGLVPNDGETHQGLYDYAMLANLPQIKSFAPRDLLDIDQIFDDFLADNSAYMMRYPKDRAEIFPQLPSRRILGGVDKIHSGKDYTVLILGTVLKEYLAIIQGLEERNLTGDLFSTAAFTPCLSPEFLESCARTGHLIILSETLKPLSFGTYISGKIAESGLSCKLLDLAIEQNLDFSGNRHELLEKSSLSALKIQQKLILYLHQQLEKSR